MNIIKAFTGLLFFILFSTTILAQDSDPKFEPENTRTFVHLFCDGMYGLWSCHIFPPENEETIWSTQHATIEQSDNQSAEGSCLGISPIITADVFFNDGSLQTLSSSFGC